mmetsp:Transcript_30902/g.78865  ORF Transcript_30902/g.78865 Transcript_30902/m.78865 type:complete len:204 (+) Transcript_30902:299-910(+)
MLRLSALCDLRSLHRRHDPPRLPGLCPLLLPVPDGVRQAYPPGLHRPLQVLPALRLLRQLPLLVLPAVVHLLQHHMPTGVPLQLLQDSELLQPSQVLVLPALVRVVRRQVPADVLQPSQVPQLLPADVQVVRHPVPAAVPPRLSLLLSLLQGRRMLVRPLPLHVHRVPQVLPGVPLLCRRDHQSEREQAHCEGQVGRRGRAAQ